MILFNTINFLYTYCTLAVGNYTCMLVYDYLGLQHVQRDTATYDNTAT